MFLRKVILKLCSKFIGENPCRDVISIKLPGTFIEITIRHGFPAYFQNTFYYEYSGWLLLFNLRSLGIFNFYGTFFKKNI